MRFLSDPSSLFANALASCAGNTIIPATTANERFARPRRPPEDCLATTTTWSRLGAWDWWVGRKHWPASTSSCHKQLQTNKPTGRLCLGTARLATTEGSECYGEVRKRCAAGSRLRLDELRAEDQDAGCTMRNAGLIGGPRRCG